VSNHVPDEDEPPREAIADTWRWRQNGASWVASLPSPEGNPASVNRWMADTVQGLLDDFESLARVRTAMLLADDGPRNLERRPEEPYSLFRARLLDSVRQHPQPVTLVELALDLRVWLRTKDFPESPELAWLSYPGIELALHLDDTAWVEFSLDNTLFSAFTYPDMDPNPLYPLNQALLEAVLRRLRARARHRLDREGELPGTYEFGFLPDRDDY
jgi:hypothetical protein